MLVTHAFVKSGVNKVQESHWNATHTLVGITVTRQYITSGQIGVTITHNFATTNAVLSGWSTTWNTNIFETSRASNTIFVTFSSPTPTTGGTLSATVSLL